MPDMTNCRIELFNEALTEHVSIIIDAEVSSAIVDGILVPCLRDSYGMIIITKSKMVRIVDRECGVVL